MADKDKDKDEDKNKNKEKEAKKVSDRIKFYERLSAENSTTHPMPSSKSLKKKGANSQAFYPPHNKKVNNQDKYKVQGSPSVKNLINRFEKGAEYSNDSPKIDKKGWANFNELRNKFEQGRNTNILPNSRKATVTFRKSPTISKPALNTQNIDILPNRLIRISANPPFMNEVAQPIEKISAAIQHAEIKPGPGYESIGDVVRRRAKKIGRKSKEQRAEPSVLTDSGWHNFIEKIQKSMQKNSALMTALKQNKQEFDKNYRVTKPGKQDTAEERLQFAKDKAIIYDTWQVLPSSSHNNNRYKLVQNAVTKAIIENNPSEKYIDLYPTEDEPDDVTLLLMLENAREMSRRGRVFITVSDLAEQPKVADKLEQLAGDMNIEIHFDPPTAEALNRYRSQTALEFEGRGPGNNSRKNRP